jgi:hypothetical protein
VRVVESASVLTVLGAVLGAILGPVFAPVGTKIVNELDKWYRQFCDVDNYLDDGRRQRYDALAFEQAHGTSLSIREESTGHRQANAAFDRAARCGSKLADAYLGQAYCFGWGVPVDRAKGATMIRKAAEDDLNLQDWNTNFQYYCPDVGKFRE